jgi:type IV pilus assembly protein PilA
MKALNIKKNEKGFTLIEVMIVLAIISTLSSIAVPNYLSFKGKARDTAAEADLKTVMKFRNLYYIEHGTFPTSDDMPGEGLPLSEDEDPDTVAKADLKTAMQFLDIYYTENGTFPATSDDMLAAGFPLSEDVSFTSYSIGTSRDGQPTVHMHIKHSSTSHAWHANYPEEGDEIEIRE